MPLTIFENLKTKTVFPMKRNERAVDCLNPALVALLVPGRAQHNRNLLQRMILVLFLLSKRDVQRGKKVCRRDLDRIHGLNR